MDIYEALLKVLSKHKGRKNAIGRPRLRSEIMALMPRGEKNISDRRMRLAIEDLRRNTDQGALICASSTHKGYWIAENLDELLESYHEERRRAINTMITIRQRLKRGRALLSGQMRMTWD